MPMLFSHTNWNDAQELKSFIPVSSGLSFERVASSLSDAERLFLLPLVGSSVCSQLSAHYADPSSSDAETAPIVGEALRESQCAVANLAFYYNYAELQVRITDQGAQRQESESGSFRTPYKYQENALRASFRNKGFNALDRLLGLLDAHSALFPGYSSTDACEERRTSIVRGIEEVNDICCIYGSRILYLRLKPHLRLAEETRLLPLVGQRAYDALKGALRSGSSQLQDGAVETLRRLAARYLVHTAVASLVRSTGSLTDRGLYFSTLTAGDGDLESRPASSEERAVASREEEDAAGRYATQLLGYIEETMPTLFAGRPSDALRRDNTGKKSFWA